MCLKIRFSALCISIWTTLFSQSALAGSNDLACAYPYNLIVKFIEGGHLVKFPDGVSYYLNPYWTLKGHISGKEKVEAFIQKLTGSVQVAPMAQAMSAASPLPANADRSAMFNDDLSPHQEGLFVFSQDGCAIEVAIVNRFGLFTTGPGNFLLNPTQLLSVLTIPMPKDVAPETPQPETAPTSGLPIYGAQMHAILEQNQNVPSEVETSGTAYIEIVVAPDGHAISAKIYTSSGNTVIDSTAVNNALEANYGAFNAEMPRSPQAFIIPVEIDPADGD